jgi:NADPH:quinone reductase-like Zn-dependent oxidoreductase
MKALRFSAFADKLQNLSVEQLPDPPPRLGEVKVKIAAASVNPVT